MSGVINATYAEALAAECHEYGCSPEAVEQAVRHLDTTSGLIARPTAEQVRELGEDGILTTVIASGGGKDYMSVECLAYYEPPDREVDREYVIALPEMDGEVEEVVLMVPREGTDFEAAGMVERRRPWGGEKRLVGQYLLNDAKLNEAMKAVKRRHLVLPFR